MLENISLKKTNKYMKLFKLVSVVSIFFLLPNYPASAESAPSLKKSVDSFNKAIKGDIEAEIYYNDTTKLIREKIIRKGNRSLKNLTLDLDFDNKFDKSLAIFYDGKGYYLQSSSLAKLDPKIGIFLPGSDVVFNNQALSSILTLDHFLPIIKKDLTITLSDYKQLGSSKSVVSLQSKDGQHYLDLLLRNGLIYALDYYVLDLNEQHNTFLFFQYTKSGKTPLKPALKYFKEKELPQESLVYISNYSLIKESGPKMVAGFLGALAGSYINTPGSAINTLFDEIFNSLPESYKLYNPGVVDLGAGIKGISFTLSGYQVCGYLEINDKSIIVGRRIFVDAPCKL